MDSEQEVISKIVEKTNLPEEEIVNKIDQKESEFSGLISRLGASYIVGKELGLDLVKPLKKELKIANVVSDMRNVNFIGKLVNISPIREFETDKGKGKVVNLTFGDETGTIRLSLWNEKTDVVDQLKQGQVFEVINGYTRKDNLGNPEIRLGRYGNLRKLEGEEINVVKTQPKYSTGYNKIALDKIEEDDFVSIQASLLQIFERNLIYFVCPSCKMKLEGNACKKHGEVEKEKLLIVSGVIDDGYGNCNVVFFRDTAENILNKSVNVVEEEIKLKGEKGFFNDLNILGKELVISGVVRKNMFNNIELVAHKIEELNVGEKSNNLLGELNG